jgi:creatinine amidohydrolase
MPPKRDWMEMTWHEFTAAERARWIAVLPVAAVEQHGPHLPLGTDAYIGEAYLARVREMLPVELPVTFLPLQAVGTSDEHRDFPGTLTMRGRAMADLLTEIGAGVARAGVRKLVIVTSHGGNAAAMDLAALDLRVRHGMFVAAASWHLMNYPPALFDADEIAHGVHGGDIETSLMLAIRPDLVRTELMGVFPSSSLDLAKRSRHLGLAGPARFAWMTQDLHASGAVGNASLASAKKGEAALAHGAAAFVELLGEVERFDLAGLNPGPLG